MRCSSPAQHCRETTARVERHHGSAVRQQACYGRPFHPSILLYSVPLNQGSYCCLEFLVLNEGYPTAGMGCASVLEGSMLPGSLHRSTGAQMRCTSLLFHRAFASGGLPPHTVMEMPALSPTMSQVSTDPPSGHQDETAEIPVSPRL